MGSASSTPSEPETLNSQPDATSPCPVPQKYRNPAIYNVYNERLNGTPASGMNPRNNMPLDPNQNPFPGQRKLLSTERVISTIPKGGTDATWVYPSPQMFFNALNRKGKGEDVVEDDMEAVVGAHNMLNEVTWGEVNYWEELHQDCNDPRLLRFLGRPDDLSPLARIKCWFGGDRPFDRHDWYVDRCGKEVRYVIDFYFDESKASSREAFTLTVRPALDSFEALNDRIKMGIYMTFAKYGLPCPISGHQGSFAAQAAATSQQSQTSQT